MRFSRIKIHAYDKFNVQKFTRKRLKYKLENLLTVLSSTLLTVVPQAHSQNDKLTRSRVSETRGYIAGTKYVHSGSNSTTCGE